MGMELKPKEVIYKIELPGHRSKTDVEIIPGYDAIIDKVKDFMGINKDGYNVYVIDEFSNEKIEVLKKSLEDFYKSKGRPDDICYVINKNTKIPIPLIVGNGIGNKIKETVDLIKALYDDELFGFYNGGSCEEKDEILDELQRKRNELISSLVTVAKENNFEVKAVGAGFSFMPLKDDEVMTEEEYEILDLEEKDQILDIVSQLKVQAEIILEELKNDEEQSLDKMRNLLKEYLTTKTMELKNELINEYDKEEAAILFLRDIMLSIEESIIDTFTSSYEDDKELLKEIFASYDISVVIDNSNVISPKVIYEEDPSITNLIGNIEYDNQNGNYVSDVHSIIAGSILKANGGCLILRASSILNSATAYSQLKKTLLTGKVRLDYNRNYYDLLSINTLKPIPVPINTKIILIGDYEIFNLLYSFDEDFNNFFKGRVEYNPVLDLSDENIFALTNNIKNFISKNSLGRTTQAVVKEVIKFLSRKAGSRNKFLYNSVEIEKLLILAYNKAIKEGRKEISQKDIIDIAYEKDSIENEMMKPYEDKKIVFNTSGEIVGSINGLSVIDVGYASFGRPIRITSICTKGSGNITDIHKESNLSGNIHTKSIGILRALLNSKFAGYGELPVDLYVSFEQLYGKLEGDSASVAELVCIMSSMGNIPIKQNFAVTGSINQFGEVQAIGGVNEKIEGFFNVCKMQGSIEDKGVLVPISNIDEIVLNKEVEEAVSKGKFHIHAMQTLDDAIEILLTQGKEKAKDVYDKIKIEIAKYKQVD